jgi:cytochrome c551/c552
MMSLDCKTCHSPTEKSIGPSFRAVAIRYQHDPNMVSTLVAKVKKGGSGKWGEVMMPAHPALKDEDIRLIIGYIQTLAGGVKIKSLPAMGTLKPTLDKPEKDQGQLTITASYTDKGGNNIKPLTSAQSLSLRNSKVKLGHHGSESTFSTDSIDLSTIKTANLAVGYGKETGKGTLTIHLDNENGEILGEFTFDGATTPGKTILQTTLREVKDGQLHRLFITRSASLDQLRPGYLQLNDK